jgi:hypothetical protein
MDHLFRERDDPRRWCPRFDGKMAIEQGTQTRTLAVARQTGFPQPFTTESDALKKITLSD